MTITDSLQRTLHFDEPPRRVISLIPSLTETLFELGLGDRVVGVSRFCSSPREEVGQRPKVGGQKDPDFKKISALDPDLIILNREENKKDDVEYLNSRYRTWVTFPRRFQDSADLLDDFGNVFDVSHRVAAWSDPIRKHPIMAPSVRVLYLIWRKPWMSVNRDTYIHDVLHSHGMINVCADFADRYPVLDEKALLALHPELILLPDEPFVFRERHREEVLQEKWAASADVLRVEGSYFCWYGVRASRASQYIETEVLSGRKKEMA